MLPILAGCCACRKGSPVIGNLEETGWVLVELMDKEAVTDVSIRFDASSKMLYGNSTCSRLYAGYHLYEKETGNIEFLQPGHTHEEGCTENSETVKLAEILQKVSTVKIDGGHLLMIDSSQNIVAIFRQQK